MTFDSEEKDVCVGGWDATTVGQPVTIITCVCTKHLQ